MSVRKSVTESVREEVDRHRHRVLKLEESAVRIAIDHKCPDHSLIRLALLRRSRDAQTVLKL